MTTNNRTRQIRFGSLLVLLTAFASFAFTPAARADSRTQTIVFDSWVEIPGSVLPAGRYLFRETDASSDRHQVLIYDYVTGILVANLPTIPQQLDKKIEGNIRYESRPGPFRGEAVAEWFRPGSHIGEQFIYGEGMTVGEATMMATAADLESASAELTATANQPSTTDTTAPVESSANHPVEASTIATPQQATAQEQPQPGAAGAQSPQQTPPAVPSVAAGDTSSVATGSDATDDATGTLPKTASEIPLIATIGAGALALAGLFSLLRNWIARSA